VTVDRVTDGTRIAQLLASELSGLDRGPLDAVTVGDADPDATPSPDGTVAYRVCHREEAVATVVLYPEYATVCLDGERVWQTPPARVATETDDTLRVDSGAAVKDAVDALVAVLNQN
jgi:hypothetical protein